MPFSGDHRSHLVIVVQRRGETPESNGQNQDDDEGPPQHYKLMVRGAPEEVIRKCSTIVTAKGVVELLGDEQLVEFEVL